MHSKYQLDTKVSRQKVLQLSKGMRQKNSYLLQGFDCLVEKNVLVKNNKNTTQDKSSVTDDCYVNNCVGYK